MLPRAISLAVAPAARRGLPQSGCIAPLQQRRHFLPSAGDVQKALEEAQRQLLTAAQKAKEESEKAAKVISENLENVAQQGPQALQGSQQELLEKAQQALEQAKEEAEKAAKVVNETLQQAAAGQTPPGLDEGKVHVMKGLEAAAEQGAQIVNAALAAAGSSQKFGGREPEGAGSDTSSTGSRPPDGASLFWKPDVPNSPGKVGRDTFISRCLSQPSSPSDMVPEVDVEQYVDFLLASALLSNSALPQAMGRQFYIKVVRLTQYALVVSLSGLEGDFVGRHMRLLWSPSPMNSFRHTTSGSLDPQLVKCLAARTLKANPAGETPAYLQELGLDAEKAQELYQDMVALSARIMMDICLSKQIRILGHEISANLVPDQQLHTAPGWETSLDEGVFGLFGEAEKERIAREFVDKVMEDPALQIRGLSADVCKQMYQDTTKVLLSLAEVALNHFRVHCAGMAFRPCLTEKTPTAEEPAASAAPE